MQLTIQINSAKLLHAKPSQFGAIVAHVMKSKHFAHVLVYKTYIAATFNVNCGKNLQDLVEADLEKNLDALLDLEPFPCPCGCGQFLAIGPCFEQSGEITRGLELNHEEKEQVHRQNRIGAIKLLRERISLGLNPDGSKKYLGLREAKDIVDKYLEEYKKNVNTPFGLDGF